jgi:hypothetical protein
MSKRRKKNRQAKLAAPPGSKRGIPRSAVIGFLVIAIPLSLGLWWWSSRSTDVSSANRITLANAAKPAATNPEFQKLMGSWQRPDGGYIMDIKSVASDGGMDAAYFNPKSIHIAKAEASRDGADTKVFIELRDANYPGSTYTLTYDPASDQLKGIYYQAVERQRFPVAFVRMK